MMTSPFFSEAERNYGASDLVPIITKQPYVRCNGQIPNMPENHAVTILEDGKEVKWDVCSLMRFNATHINVCVECAGNSRNKLPYKTGGIQWDNRGVSNVVWGGVPLAKILHKVPEDAEEIIFTSLDMEFTRSLPVKVVYECPVLLAYLMNHEKLLPEYGAPIRLVVPGWYGMASVKWLHRIYFTNKPFEGKYQTDKYTYKNKEGCRPVTLILPKSLITSIVVQNPVVIRGKAWSGVRVDKVEVGVDDTWALADIVKRTGDYGWVAWEKKMFLNGLHKISSRATDVVGVTQPAEAFYNDYGYGNNHIQSIQIDA